jgi:hypothetical protein
MEQAARLGIRTDGVCRRLTIRTSDPADEKAIWPFGLRWLFLYVHLFFLQFPTKIYRISPANDDI